MRYKVFCLIKLFVLWYMTGECQHGCSLFNIRQRPIVLSVWCLTAESPADCIGEAEESDVLLSHRRAALARNASQSLHRAAHRSAADRVRDNRPQLHHPVLQEQRERAQSEDTHMHTH